MRPHPLAPSPPRRPARARAPFLLAALAAAAAAACAPPATRPAPRSPAARAGRPAEAARSRAGVAAARADGAFITRWSATNRFQLGAPGGFRLTPQGDALLFLRSGGPRSFVRDLYELDLRTGAERVLLTATQLLQGREEQLSPEERARRERMRVTGRGVTSFAIAPDGRTVLVPLSGRLYLFDRAAGRARELATRASAPAIDARFSPDGARVAAVRGGALYVTDVATGAERVVSRPASPAVTHGLADFIAQEEMDRYEGYWWSPDASTLAFQETDATPVEQLLVADPARPERPPEGHRFPRAGRPNAIVRLGLVAATGGGAVTWVSWDRARYPYLATARWSRGGPLLLVVQDRAQSECVVLAAERDGRTRALVTERDAAWVELDQTVPRWLPDGSGFLWSAEREGARVLELRGRDGALVRALTPPSLGYRRLTHVDPAAGVVYVNGGPEPSEAHVFRVALAGNAPAQQLTRERGEHDAVFAEPEPRAEARPGAAERAPGVWLHVASLLDAPTRWTVERDAAAPQGAAAETPAAASGGAPSAAGAAAGAASGLAVRSVAEEPGVAPQVELLTVGERAFRAAVVRPRGFDPRRRYPVIVNVYGGPGARIVVAARNRYLLSQWMADHGFVVVQVDGRGTPYRGREWSRAVRGRLGDVPLDDQVEGLRALGARLPELDLTRVGIFGWSFGGYLAALAVERHPELFRVAVAGAPVADWRDYDTHYTERYLGMPSEHAADYDRASLLTHAPALARPLLIVHGTADDNVFFLHGVRLSDALFRAGRPHLFLPLAGQTHVVSDPAVVGPLYSRIMALFERELGG